MTERPNLFLAALVGAVAVLGLTASSAAAAELLQDGSFEAGASGHSPAWTDAGTGPYPSALCTTAGLLACEDGDGTAGPRTGDVWAWFGGSGDPQTQSLSQRVLIPQGAVELSFNLWIGAARGDGDETLTVALDGTNLFTASQATPGFGGNYHVVARDLTSFGDGSSHNLSFAYVNPTAAPPGLPLDPDPTTNINVDDVSLATNIRAKPKIKLLTKPKKHTRRPRARFQWSANEPGVKFQCKLDRKAVKECVTGRRYTRLKPGRHKFTLVGTDLDGNESDPVIFKWKQKRPSK